MLSQSWVRKLIKSKHSSIHLARKHIVLPVVERLCVEPHGGQGEPEVHPWVSDARKAGRDNLGSLEASPGWRLDPLLGPRHDHSQSPAQEGFKSPSYIPWWSCVGNPSFPLQGV